MKDGMYLELYHGRSDPSQKMGDWGEQGPVFGPLVFAHTTYGCDIKLRFESEDSILPWLPPDMTRADFSYRLVEAELSIDEGLVFYDNMYYGDWSLFIVRNGMIDGHLLDEEMIERWKVFDESRTRDVPPV